MPSASAGRAEGFSVADLDYALPDALIAQEPAPERDAARMLWMARGGPLRGHHRVRDLPTLIEPALIVLNDTRVVPSRLFGEKPTGGKVELLLVERLSGPGSEERWRALGRASKGLSEGQALELEGGISARVVARAPDATLEVVLSANGPVGEAVARSGHVPLPPYIRRADEPADRERYQTVYAENDGAVAAPTAGLHFTGALLERLAAAGHELARITLHVGPGTFAPLKTERLEAHTMHAERYRIPAETAHAVERARLRGRPVLAVGTTVVRALETAARPDRTIEAGEGETALFIHPPQELRVVDAMLTNFHLPRSTLLALVMAFAGVEPTRAAYRAAIEEGYRFYSYGDAMLIGGEPRGRPEGGK